MNGFGHMIGVMLFGVMLIAGFLSLFYLPLYDEWRKGYVSDGGDEDSMRNMADYDLVDRWMNS